MGTPRIDKVRDYICDILGSNTDYTVYVRPPRNVQLNYPCVIIAEDNSRVRHADNMIYIKKKKYTLTVITRDDSDETYDFLEENLRYCKYQNRFISDNLYHYKLILYY